MRITHVVRQFYPSIGGLENVVRDLAFMQVRNGHQVRIVTLNRSFSNPDLLLPERETLNGVEIVRIPYRGSRRYPLAPQVLKHITDAEIVHVHAIDFFFDFLAFTSFFHRKPLVVTTHGGFFHTSFASTAKKIYFHIVTRLMLTFYRSVICLSRTDFETFTALRRRGIVWWDPGVDTEKFRGAGALSPTRTLLTISRFSVNKRIDRLLTFLAVLRKRDPSWRLVIAGLAWDYTAAEIEAMAVKAGVAEAVRVIAQPSDDALREAIGSSSVFVSASEYEAFGIAAVEGMSAGMMPLLSNIRSYSDIAARTGVGTIVDFKQVEQAVETFLSQWKKVEGHYDDYRSQAIKAAAPFAWVNVARKFDPVYEAALGIGYRTILDVPIEVAHHSQAIAELDEAFERGEQTLVSFANAHTLNVASTNPAFRNVLMESTVYNDGIGVDLASRLLFGSAFPDNLNGTDFTPAYLANTKHTFKIFLFGSKPGVVERAAEALAALTPHHAIVGFHHGYGGEAENAMVVESIRASGADVVLVAMGNPRQELWLAQNLKATGCRHGFAIGALLDFLAGNVPRAPEWVRRYRLEWGYRLWNEPGRLWKRYLVGNGVFLLRVLGQWFSGARM